MAQLSAKEFGKLLPDRIRLLSGLIARKPKSFSSKWATSPEQAFSLYTRTSTVNLINSCNDVLIHLGWPFPAFVNLQEELGTGRAAIGVGRLRRFWSSTPTLMGVLTTSFMSMVSTPFGDSDPKQTEICAAGMVALFNQHSKEIFAALYAAKILESKQRILRDVQEAYRRNLWAACISTTVPILDFITRALFETEDLKVSLQTLRDGFIRYANLRPKDVKPGYPVWEGERDPEKGNSLAKSLGEDLRLPGVYLASFLEFADRYYEWYSSTNEKPRTPLNRHAVMHCGSEYWTETNAVRILTFLHLTVSLEPFLRVLVVGEDALSSVEKLRATFAH